MSHTDCTWVKNDLQLLFARESQILQTVSFFGVLMYLPPCITKTRLYSFDPLKPHFYTVKRGFTGVYIIFLISAQKHRLWVLVRTASVLLTSTYNLRFEQKYEKYQTFYLKNFHFLVVKFSIYLDRCVFKMNHGSFISRLQLIRRGSFHKTLSFLDICNIISCSWNCMSVIRCLMHKELHHENISI